MELQKLLSYTRRAVEDYQMIEDGDKIAIGISGGKDSLTLLYALANLKRFYPKNFDVIALTVDLGYKDFDVTTIRLLCSKLKIEYDVVHTEISKILFEERKEKNPCSLCAKMRKGALNQEAKNLGCNKIAYAHHMDDIIETAFLSMIFEGRFYSFAPVTYLDQSRLSVIRPLMYVPEVDVKGFAKKYELPVVKNPCPVDGSTQREYVKNLIRQLNIDHPGVKKRLFHAIKEGNIEGWERKKENEGKSLL